MNKLEADSLSKETVSEADNKEEVNEGVEISPSIM